MSSEMPEFRSHRPHTEPGTKIFRTGLEALATVLRWSSPEVGLKFAIAFTHGTALWLLVLGLPGPALAADADPTRDEVIAAMKPCEGPAGSGEHSTLTGKVMCGYQGWFTAEGDGSGRGWYHYTARSGFEPGSCSIDLWPDLSEFADDEKFATPFRHADGRVAHVFASTRRATVLRPL